MMDHSRRTILKCAGAIGALVVGLATALTKPSNVSAAPWSRTGFDAKAVADVLKSLGAEDAVDSKDIAITAPDIAENGAVVPVAATSRLPNTQQIAIVAERNPFPLVAMFDVSGTGEGYVSTRIKMSETSHVWAVVKSGAKFFSARKEVKITVGGCG